MEIVVDMSRSPPSYEEAVNAAQGGVYSEPDDMNLDAVTGVGISRGEGILESLPHYPGMGSVVEFFKAEISGEPGKEKSPLCVEAGHILKELIKLCNEMDSKTNQKCAYANTANTFMHKPFDNYILLLLRDTYPDLENLHALRAHSMKHILERCLEKWNKPDKVISELLTRVFGLMCVVWELLSKEYSLHNQVNSQAAGLSAIEERMHNAQAELQNNLCQLSSTLLKAENIAGALEKLEQADSSAKQLQEMTALNTSMTKMCKDVRTMKEYRQADVQNLVDSVQKKTTLQTTLSESEKNLKKSKDTNKELLTANNTMHDTILEVNKENGLSGLFHDEQKRTIEALQGSLAGKDVTIAALQGSVASKDVTIAALQGSVASKDVTIAALQQLLQFHTAQQGHDHEGLF